MRRSWRTIRFRRWDGGASKGGLQFHYRTQSLIAGGTDQHKISSNGDPWSSHKSSGNGIGAVRRNTVVGSRNNSGIRILFDVGLGVAVCKPSHVHARISTRHLVDIQ